jgi:hypothetical protein
VISVTPAALALLLGAALELAPGEDLAGAAARARPGDVLRLPAGTHRGALGDLAGVAVEGAGAGETVIVAPEGEDAVHVKGEVSLRGLTLRAGAGRCALKVLGGAARLEGVALSGGSCGAFVDGGSLEAREVELRGGYGLLLQAGRVRLDGGTARGAATGLAVLGGELSVRRFDVVGPAREGGLAVSRGSASLDAVTLRAPGPTGISVSGGGTVEGSAVTIAGATEEQGFLGACVQILSGSLRLSDALLVGCAGAALEASGGTISLRASDASGGVAGCLVLLGARAALEGNVCAGRGPGLVLAGGARASAVANRWWTDPALWVDCGSGARVELGRGETVRQPCSASR